MPLPRHVHWPSALPPVTQASASLPPGTASSGLGSEALSQPPRHTPDPSGQKFMAPLPCPVPGGCLLSDQGSPSTWQVPSDSVLTDWHRRGVARRLVGPHGQTSSMTPAVTSVAPSQAAWEPSLVCSAQSPPIIPTPQGTEGPNQRTRRCSAGH